MDTVEGSDLSFLNSTNGRSFARAPLPLRLGFRALAWSSPSRAERVAAWLFCHPRRTASSRREVDLLNQGHAFRIRARGHDLAAWSWGDGPTVLLHHGWGGSAAHMVRFVRPLVDAGFSVVAYDAPAHGASSGRITAAPEMARVISAVAARLGGLHAVVGHSIGGAATLLAVRGGLSLERAVLLAPPSDLRGFVDVFGEHLDLDPAVRDGMARRAASWFGIDWPQMDVEHWAGGMRPPLLVVHDRDDDVVPWAHGMRVRDAWERAEMLTTSGLRHRRTRREPQVIERAVQFLAEERPESRRVAAASS
jgi:pimeloyl-ACP methyl ester carboxylesterase